VRDYAIALSRQLRNYGSKFVLGNREYIPHISLYHIAVRQENFAAFREEAGRIWARLGGGRLKLRGIELPLLMTEKPKWLERLHDEVVERTVKFFDWDSGAKDSWRADGVRQRRYVEKYGSPYVRGGFKPHITLTSFEDKSVVKEIPALEFKPMSFEVNHLYICELGPSHSCRRIVARSD